MASEIRYRKFKLNLNVDYTNFNPGTYEKLDRVKKKGIYSIDINNQHQERQAINYGICKLENERIEKVNQIPKNASNNVYLNQKSSVNPNSRLLTKRNSDAGILKQGKGRKLKATADKLIKSKSYGDLSTLGTDDEADLSAVTEYTANLINQVPDKAKFGENEESVYEELGNIEREESKHNLREKFDQTYTLNKGKRKQVTIKEPVYDKVKEFKSDNKHKGKQVVRKKSNLPVIEKLCDLEHKTLEKQTQALKKVSSAHQQLNHMGHEKSGRSRLVTRRTSDAGAIQPSQLQQVLLKKTPDKLVKSKTCPDFSKAGVNQKGSQKQNTEPMPVNFMLELEQKLKQRLETNSIQSGNISEQSAEPTEAGVIYLKSNVSTKENDVQGNYKPPINDPHRRRSGIPRLNVKVNSDAKVNSAVNLNSGKSQITNSVAEKPIKCKSWADFANHWEQYRAANSKKVVKEESIYDSLGNYDRRNLKDFDQNNNREECKESDDGSHTVSDLAHVNNKVAVNSRLIKKRNSDAGILKYKPTEVKNPAKVILVRAKTFTSFDTHEKSLQSDHFNISPRKHKQAEKLFVEHVYESLPDVRNDNLSNKEELGKATKVRFYCPSDEINEQSKQKDAKVPPEFNHLNDGKPNYSRLRTKRNSDAGILKNGRSELSSKGLADSLVEAKSFGSFSQIERKDNEINEHPIHSDNVKSVFKEDQNAEDVYDDLADFRRDTLSSIKECGSDGVSSKNGYINGPGSEAEKEINTIYGNLLSVDLERLRQVLKLNANAVVLPDKYLKSEDNSTPDNGINETLKGNKGNPSLLGKILLECKEFLDQGGK